MSDVRQIPLLPFQYVDPITGDWVSNTTIATKRIDLSVGDFKISDWGFDAYIFHAGFAGFEIGNAGFGYLVFTMGGPPGHARSTLLPMWGGTRWGSFSGYDLEMVGNAGNIFIENWASGGIRILGVDYLFLISGTDIELDPGNQLYVRSWTSPDQNEFHGVDDGAPRDMFIYDDVTIGSPSNPRTFTKYGDFYVIQDFPQYTEWRDPSNIVQFQIFIDTSEPGLNVYGAESTNYGYWNLYITPTITSIELTNGASSGDFSISVPSVGVPLISCAWGLYIDCIGPMTINTASTLRLETVGFPSTDIEIVPSRDLLLQPANDLLISPTGDILIPPDKPVYFDGALGIGTKYLKWNSTSLQFEFNNSLSLEGGAGTYFAPPRMTTAQRNAMVAGWGAGQKGRMWFNTDTNQWEGWSGSAVAIIG